MTKIWEKNRKGREEMKTLKVENRALKKIFAEIDHS